MEKKTLLLLGGSRQQVVAIEAAKKCGYRTVLCDYLPDNPGQHYADAFYLVSTTDRAAVLEVAQKEAVDGVIAYSSDPASPTAAYVAQVMGLPSNPLESVEIMSSKHLFRRHLQEHGFPCPQAYGFPADQDVDTVARAIAGFRFPIVVKPTDSSGSKGVTILDSCEGLQEAIVYADSFGRNGILIVEEYIHYGFPRVVGGDVFVVDGKVEFWGLMSCFRDEACPLVPVGERLPSGLTDIQYQNAKQVLQGLVTSLGIQFGELNVEIIIGTDDQAYVLELGSRAGGNLIPVQLSDASGIDLVEANVLCAMGERPTAISWEADGACYATYVLHVSERGRFGGFALDDSIASACYNQVMYYEQGQEVDAFIGAHRAIGILLFRFGTRQQLDDFTRRHEELVRVRFLSEE